MTPLFESLLGAWTELELSFDRHLHKSTYEELMTLTKVIDAWVAPKHVIAYFKHRVSIELTYRKRLNPPKFSLFNLTVLRGDRK